MTYHVFVHFDVPPDKREDFVKAASFDASGSLEGEPGTLRFEVLQDADNPNRFYLDEVYEDEEAFIYHSKQETIKKFYELVGGYAQGPNFWARSTKRNGTVVKENGS
ncbi:putative quinol monooxygenase [Segniliparus rugosus]|uniref:ABM domain-containing protein n=1 Tax=Segniliparus rugosus (strain ATCC BAA-974 / DSM 45345 / CCUG 50838 / CIP 108380 / JCM 13579 / CDC 945) TaxID=679197 RepID=E5XU92_SEGRC|nr:putative quinol monooxygenase [Segniliparus rugosus]EFV12091.1 hypothetical protein HMPREF9336_03064 [Segniliparus rugosus ATCC BAA-974]